MVFMYNDFFLEFYLNENSCMKLQDSELSA